ncbi:S-phase kinase-associated protein 2 [Gouania willdenowi]|uniref:S-phase kinase-associated protein 2 n=1 Tax=Gouania willdenowi TaxID=441366 RepID=UPI0010563308|nr:S-phase kinase-associated protein 2 [Gouania willdenowi]
MSTQSVPLQELPCLRLQGSMLLHSSGMKKRKPALVEGLDSECTPTSGASLQWSPPLKHQRVTDKGKENEENRFVLGRRSRRRKETRTGISWDALPDELILTVLVFLPLHDLLRVSVVCRRWHRLVSDQSLWISVDLEGLTHSGPALQSVLNTGVSRLRCPRCCVDQMLFSGSGPLQMVEMDLSSSIIPPSALQSIVSRCRRLQRLSLEGLTLSDAILESLALNSNLQQVNLSGCSGFSASALSDMLRRCSSVEQLNVSWCDFSREHVEAVVANVSSAVTQLNLSGYRESLTLNEVTILVERCPRIQTLDLSDSTLLTAESFSVLEELKFLHHLSLSRCYNIHLAALTDLGRTLPALVLLDVFGLLQDTQLQSLKKEMTHVSINARPFSSIARPTPSSALSGDPTMWGRRCRLSIRV